MRISRRIRLGFFCLFLVGVASARSTHGAELAMGFRVGEVTHHSAILWTRVTATAERNQNGYREPKKRQPKVAEYTPSPVSVSERQGNVDGAAGEIRVSLSLNPMFRDPIQIDWTPVRAKNDFVFKQKLNGLRPGAKYHVRVEARDGAGAKIVKREGVFRTAQTKDQWQDVKFGVITGQSYWDLDHPDGYHIYPAMQAEALDFLVSTGDTVYLDSEAPRARTIELARHHWRRMYSLPRVVEFHRTTPGYWEVDDHDSYVNDGWPSIDAKWMQPLTYPQGARIFREQNPVPEITYRTIRWGKGLQIWLVEGRDYRSPNTDPDGPQKSIWGAAQMKWLKQSILASDADFRILISPTPIVGPDRSGKKDNHANKAFAYEGNAFRRWTQKQGLSNFFVCCGDRHWQYYSIDPATQLREFSCGPASDKHAGGSPGEKPEIQPFHRVKGGYLTVQLKRPGQTPTVSFRHHGVQGKVVNQIDFTNAD